MAIHHEEHLEDGADVVEQFFVDASAVTDVIDGRPEGADETAFGLLVHGILDDVGVNQNVVPATVLFAGQLGANHGGPDGTAAQLDHLLELRELRLGEELLFGFGELIVRRGFEGRGERRIRGLQSGTPDVKGPFKHITGQYI